MVSVGSSLISLSIDVHLWGSCWMSSTTENWVGSKIVLPFKNRWGSSPFVTDSLKINLVVSCFIYGTKNTRAQLQVEEPQFSLQQPLHSLLVLVTQGRWEGVPLLNRDLWHVSHRGWVGHSSTYSTSQLIPQVFPWVEVCWQPGLFPRLLHSPAMLSWKMG